MDILSTKRVAELLGVSEATVKRWADAGMLRCFRTRGGHRKFRLRDVKAFLNDEAPPPPPPIPTVSSTPIDLTDAARTARELALAADVDGLVSLVAHEHLRGKTLAQTFDEVFAPALRSVGESWAQKNITAAHEHVASNAVVDMIARVRPLVESRAKTSRGRALCASVADEHHDIATRMAALVLLEQGYKPAVLGANVPTADLAMLIASERPAVVALSASACASPDVLRGDIAVLASAATAARSRIVVGGEGFAAVGSLPGTVRRHARLAELHDAAEPSRLGDGARLGDRFADGVDGVGDGAMPPPDGAPPEVALGIKQ